MALNEKLLNLVKNEAKSIGISTKSDLSTEFRLTNGNRFLPSSVYFLGLELNSSELQNLQNEAKKFKSLGKGMTSPKPVIEISSTFYMLYSGIDQEISKRLREHCRNPNGTTGSLRLSSYNTLREKKLYCGVVVVDEERKLEKHLQEKYPNLLKTINRKIEESLLFSE